MSIVDAIEVFWVSFCYQEL